MLPPCKVHIAVHHVHQAGDASHVLEHPCLRVAGSTDKETLCLAVIQDSMITRGPEVPYSHFVWY